MTSQTRWCSPRSPVEPMYMPGRLRTASRPSRTWIALASYLPSSTAEPELFSSATYGFLFTWSRHRFGRRSRDIRRSDDQPSVYPPEPSFHGSCPRPGGIGGEIRFLEAL